MSSYTLRPTGESDKATRRRSAGSCSRLTNPSAARRSTARVTLSGSTVVCEETSFAETGPYRPIAVIAFQPEGSIPYLGPYMLATLRMTLVERMENR